MGPRWPPMDLHTLLPDRRPLAGGWEAAVVDRLEAPAAALAFWCAVALPAVYLGLLASGLDTPADLQAFLGLLALHFVALVAGRHHRTGPVERRPERPADRQTHAD